MDYQETTIKTENIYDGKVIKLRVDTVELPNRKYSKREIVEHDDVVAILATKDSKMVVIERYRKSFDNILLEVPAGMVEQGETPLDAAMREFEEETGYIANNCEYVCMAYASPGYSTEKIHFFIVNDFTVSDNKRTDEAIKVIEMPLDEIKEKIELFDIKDMKTILGYNLVKESMDGNN